MGACAVRCSIACSCFGEGGLATPVLRKVWVSYHAGKACARPARLWLAPRAPQLSLEVLDHAHETIGGFDDFPGVLRQIVLVNRAVFDRSSATPDLAKFPLDLIEVRRLHAPVILRRTDLARGASFQNARRGGFNAA